MFYFRVLLQIFFVLWNFKKVLHQTPYIADFLNSALVLQKLNRVENVASLFQNTVNRMKKNKLIFIFT